MRFAVVCSRTLLEFADVESLHFAGINVDVWGLHVCAVGGESSRSKEE